MKTVPLCMNALLGDLDTSPATTRRISSGLTLAHGDRASKTAIRAAAPGEEVRTCGTRRWGQPAGRSWDRAGGRAGGVALCPGTESNCLHTDFQSVALPV